MSCIKAIPYIASVYLGGENFSGMIFLNKVVLVCALAWINMIS